MSRKMSKKAAQEQRVMRERLRYVQAEWVNAVDYSGNRPSFGPGEKWYYGDLAHSGPSCYRSNCVTRENARHVAVFIYSDYIGSSYDRSNCDVLLRDFPNATCELYGGHGTRGVLISADYVGEELPDVIAGTVDYPLIDEEHHSELEMNAADEAWEGFLSFDVPRDLVTRATPGGYNAHSGENDKPGYNRYPLYDIPRSPFYGAHTFLEDYLESLASHDSDYPRIHELFYEFLHSEKSNECPYFETADSIVFPEYEKQLSFIAEKILADIMSDYPPITENTSDYEMTPGQMRMEFPA